MLGDAEVEADEGIALVLSAPTGGAVLGAPSLAALTVTDDDAAAGGAFLRFGSAAIAAVEGDGGDSTGTITVTRSGDAAGAVSVDYATGGGSATVGTDYAAASGGLSWAAGDMSAKSFAITIHGDTADEADETVGVTLNSPVGATLASPSAALLTIVDDDVADATGGTGTGTTGSTGGGTSSGGGSSNGSGDVGCGSGSGVAAAIGVGLTFAIGLRRHRA